MDSDTASNHLFTMQESSQKMNDISNALQFRFGDKWKTVLILTGSTLIVLCLFLIALDTSKLEWRGLEFGGHLKALLIVFLFGVAFFCFWVAVLPEQDDNVYGIIPYPKMDVIVAVDSTQCGRNPTLCDSEGQCSSVCVDQNGATNYDCVKIPLDKNNIYYLGSPLQAGKSYCLPKVAELRTLLSSGGCGTYTGKIIWGIGQDGSQKWMCQCLYPELFGDPGQGCLAATACGGTGKLIDQTDGKTAWDPANMPASLVNVSPYEKMPDGSPRFRCQCGTGSYNLPEDPFACHANVCYAGASAESTTFNTTTRQCECNPANNTIKSNVSGFCYPLDQCNPDPVTGGCRYGVDIFEKSGGTLNPILFKGKDGKVYMSDMQNGNAYLIDVTSNIADMSKIVDVSTTLLVDAFYAFPVRPGSTYSGGSANLSTAIGQLLNVDMRDRLQRIGLAAVSATGTPGIPSLCNSFYSKHGDNVKNCQNPLNKSGSEALLANFSSISCGPGNSVVLNVFNPSAPYTCQCAGGSKLSANGLACITCVKNGEHPPNSDQTQCCSGYAAYPFGEGSGGAGNINPQDFACADKPDGCFLPDTLVSMADGSQKRIDEIEAGDFVLSGRDLQPVQVMFVDSMPFKRGQLIGVNSVKPFFTWNHTLMGPEGVRMAAHPELAQSTKHWDKVTQLDEGSTLLMVDMIDPHSSRKIRVDTIHRRVVDDEIIVHNLVTSDHTFVANGFCVYDDFPEIEKHPVAALRLVKALQLVMSGVNITHAVAQVRELSVNLEDFDDSLAAFFETAAISPQIVRVADELWKNHFDSF
jgi:hypothetical protein